jgi:hypothetical protein
VIVVVFAVHTSSALLLHFVKVKVLFSSKIYSFEALQWRSPSWVRVGHGPPGKIKKLAIIGLLCEILYNFVSVLGFG